MKNINSLKCKQTKKSCCARSKLRCANRCSLLQTEIQRVERQVCEIKIRAVEIRRQWKLCSGVASRYLQFREIRFDDETPRLEFDTNEHQAQTITQRFNERRSTRLESDVKFRQAQWQRQTRSRET